MPKIDPTLGKNIVTDKGINNRIIVVILNYLVEISLPFG
jgi:hypothetical protein